MVMKFQNAKDNMQRGIDNIAYDILEDWSENYTKDIPLECKPYLNAMTQIVSIDEMYGYDSAESVVIYFLLNAKGKYSTEKSEQYLNELKSLVDWED